MTFSGVRDFAAVAAVAAQHPGATLLDIQAASQALVVAQRTRMLASLAVGFLLLIGVVAVALRDATRTTRVLAPLTLTTFVVIAALQLAGVSLNVFHLISLILAAGLGLDYALFFEHAADDTAEHARTLHAVLVCATATLMVFALLAAAELPVLRAIGAPVALGVVTNFVLALLLTRPVRRSPCSSPSSAFAPCPRYKRVDAGHDQRVALRDVRLHGRGRDAEVAERHARGAAHFRDAANRRDDDGIVDLPHLLKTRRQVVRSEQHCIDAGHFHDRFDVVDRARVLGLNDHRDLVVRGAQVLAKGLAVSVRARETHAAFAVGRIPRPAHDVRGLRSGVDLRHDDAVRAEVERALDRHLGHLRHAHDARGLVADGLQNLARARAFRAGRARRR